MAPKDRKPLWIVRQVVRRPCLVMLCSMGPALGLTGTLGAGVIMGFLNVQIDISEGSFTVVGDEVADRHRSYAAAQSETSVYTPAHNFFVAEPPSAPPPPNPPWPPQSPSLPPTPGADYIRYDWEPFRPGIMLHFEATDGGDLMTADRLSKIRAFQDEVKAIGEPLCKRRDAVSGARNRFGPRELGRPEGICEGFFGPTELLYAPRKTRDRFTTLSIPIPSIYTSTLSSQLPAANTAATRADGRLNATELLTQLGLSTSALPSDYSSHLDRLGDGFSCAVGATLVANQLVLSNCGPVIECCGCGCSVDDVERPPLCEAASDGSYVTYSDAWSVATNASTALTSPTLSLMPHVRTEVSCSPRDESELQFGSWWFDESYRNGSEANVVRFRTQMALGIYINAQTSTAEERTSTWRSTYNEYSNMLTGRIIPLIKSWNREQTDMRVAVWGHGRVLVTYEIISHLIGSMMWAAPGGMLAYMYMTFHLGSLLLCMAGMFGVLISFPTTWFLYNVVFQRPFFGMFNFMAAFVIVGIGVDDIFVFMDAWKQSRERYSDKMERMDYAYRRSFNAMTITSVTDSAAFYCNCISSITIVRLFGIFMGTLVLVNFLLVITWFAAVVSWHHRAGFETPCTFCCAKPSRQSKEEKETPESPPTIETKVHSRFGWTRHVEHFFGNKFVDLLQKGRYIIVVLAIIVAGVAGYSVTQLQPTERDFRYESFADDSNIMIFLEQVEAYDGSPISYVTVTWGLEGLDRQYLDPNDPYATEGTPIWLSGFDPSTADAQRAVLKVCEEAGSLDVVRTAREKMAEGSSSSSTPIGPMPCFMQHFRDWMIEMRGNTGWPAPPSEFNDLISEFGLFSTRRYGNASCTTLPGTNSLLESRCYAFWASASPYLDDDSLPDWSRNLGWSCPVYTEEKRCYLPTPSYDAEGTPYGGDDEREEWRGFVPQLKMISLSYPIKMSQFSSAYYSRSFFTTFESIVSDANAMVSSTTFKAVQGHERWPQMRLEELMISAGFIGCSAALVISFIALIVFLRNPLMALLAVAHIALIAALSVGAMVWLGWKFGFIEAVCVTVVMGFSVDFTAHISIAYIEAKGGGGEEEEKEGAVATRYERTKQALSELGISVMSGAVSTLISSIFLAQGMMKPNAKFGIFMAMNISFSVLVALVVFPSSLLIVGPTGDTCDLSRYCRRKGGNASSSSEA